MAPRCRKNAYFFGVRDFLSRLVWRSQTGLGKGGRELPQSEGRTDGVGRRLYPSPARRRPGLRNAPGTLGSG